MLKAINVYIPGAEKALGKRLVQGLNFVPRSQLCLYCTEMSVGDLVTRLTRALIAPISVDVRLN